MISNSAISQHLAPGKAAWLLARGRVGIQKCIRANKTTDAFGNVVGSALGSAIGGQIEGYQREQQLQREEDARDGSLANAFGLNPSSSNAPQSIITSTLPDGRIPASGLSFAEDVAMRKVLRQQQPAFIAGFNEKISASYDGYSPGTQFFDTPLDSNGNPLRANVTRKFSGISLLSQVGSLPNHVSTTDGLPSRGVYQIAANYVVNDDGTRPSSVPSFYTAYNTLAKRTDFVIGQSDLPEFMRSTAGYQAASDFERAPVYVKAGNAAVSAVVRGDFGKAAGYYGQAWGDALTDPGFLLTTALGFAGVAVSGEVQVARAIRPTSYSATPGIEISYINAEIGVPGTSSIIKSGNGVYSQRVAISEANSVDVVAQSGGLGGLRFERTEGLSTHSSMADLKATGALPGEQGVIITDRAVRFGDVYELGTLGGRKVEFSLVTETVDGLIVKKLYSGDAWISPVPRDSRLLGHVHPNENAFQKWPSPADMGVVNGRYFRELVTNPNAKPAPTRIFWGPGNTDNTIFYPGFGKNPVHGK